MNTATLIVGSRESKLAQCQVWEVLKELKGFYPDISFNPIFRKSTGDLDQKTSLRTLDKTDFFTKEIDALVLSGQCRIGIHSAKDLPDPLPEGLKMVALTKGLGSSDSLVMREKDTLETLPEGAIIATSSIRREEAVTAMRPGFTFIDLRGTIEMRLKLLEQGQADGVVVAEAALIRLGLTSLNRVKIPGSTTALQGQLAIIAREGDQEMEELFSCIDSRPRIFYTGLSVPYEYRMQRVHHCPLIEIHPVPQEDSSIKQALANFASYTHLIFTSKTAVTLFFDYAINNGISKETIIEKTILAVGTATAGQVRALSDKECLVAGVESAEGVVSLMTSLLPDLKKIGTSVLWPHAALSRPLIAEWLKERNIHHVECVLYHTRTRALTEKPELKDFDEIVFTSPSTVDAFLDLYGALPDGQQITIKAIGSVTEQRLMQQLHQQSC